MRYSLVQKVFSMGFRDFVNTTKKSSAAIAAKQTVASSQNIIDGESGQIQIRTALGETKPAPQRQEKQDISYRDSEIQGFVSQSKGFSRQSTDDRHGSIIRNIASESNRSSQMGGGTNWEQCKFHKNSAGRDFCAEFHSLCAKSNCKRARK